LAAGAVLSRRLRQIHRGANVLLRNPACPAGVVPQQRSGFMHKEAGRIVETPVEARQGFLDRPVLVVLVVSTSLVIALFALVYFGYFGA
jgi:hypothetical protein